MDHVSRRSLLTLAAASPLAFAAYPASALSPVQRSGEPRLKLSHVAFSMRQYLDADPGEPGAMDLFDFVSWSAELGFDGVELTSYYFPGSFEAGFLHDLKRHCHIEGMPISGGGIRNNLTHPPDTAETDEQLAHIERWAEHYHRLGAPAIRIFSGSPAGGIDDDQAVEHVITNLERVGEIGRRHGVIMAIENHGHLRDPDRLAAVIEAVNDPWVGLTLDADNWDDADPYEQFARFAPYAVNVHMKVKVTPPGASPEPTDYPRMLDALTDAGYRGYVGLEYEEPEDPYDAIPQHYRELREAM